MKYITHGNNTINVVNYMKNNFYEEWDEDNDGLIYTESKSIYADKKFKTIKW